MSQSLKEYYKNGGVNPFLGKRHTEETKAKIGAKNSKYQTGKNNSQYGTMWITNGLKNKKIKKHESIPRGWKGGRIIRT